ncbi:hypothetical protein ACGF4C_35350 [Streptomyces sp. NPDC048197]|uniref:hypothetical protein n=1 Tax=Streptomyces sp. NPDC048197 TaxID=3365511 RepID=UPI00371F7FB6
MVTNRAGMKGAPSDIGNTTARHLAERGSTVLVHGRTAEEAQADNDAIVQIRAVIEWAATRGGKAPAEARLSPGPGNGVTVPARMWSAGTGHGLTAQSSADLQRERIEPPVGLTTQTLQRQSSVSSVRSNRRVGLTTSRHLVFPWKG